MATHSTSDTKPLPTNKPPKQDERGSGSCAPKRRRQLQLDDEVVAKKKSFRKTLMDTVELAESLVGTKRAVLLIDVDCINDTLAGQSPTRGVFRKKVPVVTVAGNLEQFDFVLEALTKAVKEKVPKKQEKPNHAMIFVDIHHGIEWKQSEITVRGNPLSVGFVVEMLKKGAEELRDPSKEQSVKLVFLGGESCKWFFKGKRAI